MVEIDGLGTRNYGYDVDTDNKNLISLGELSRDRISDEAEKYPTLAKYETYYGTVNYGDIWIRAALGGNTTLELQRGRSTFLGIGLSGRACECTQRCCRFPRCWCRRRLLSLSLS